MDFQAFLRPIVGEGVATCWNFAVRSSFVKHRRRPESSPAAEPDRAPPSAGQSGGDALPLGIHAFSRRAHVNGVLDYLLANPILLAPVLLVAAMMVFAILKKLLKIAAILAIAGALYALLIRYVEGGL